MEHEKRGKKEYAPHWAELSAWSFKFIPKVFVPALDKQYFTVDMWLPEGTTIGETDRIAGEISDYIRTHEETEMVSSYIGRTPPRYYLSNISFGPQSNYAQLLVKCKSSKESRALNALLQDSIRLKYPEPLIKVNKFELSPLTEAMIEARFLDCHDRRGIEGERRLQEP